MAGNSVLVTHVSEAEWKFAEEQQEQYRQTTMETFEDDIAAEWLQGNHPHKKISELTDSEQKDLQTALLKQQEVIEQKTAEQMQLAFPVVSTVDYEFDDEHKDIVKHDIWCIEGKLYALANSQEHAMLGSGSYGQAYLATDQQQQSLVVKLDSAELNKTERLIFTKQQQHYAAEKPHMLCFQRIRAAIAMPYFPGTPLRKQVITSISAKDLLTYCKQGKPPILPECCHLALNNLLKEYEQVCTGLKRQGDRAPHILSFLAKKMNKRDNSNAEKLLYSQLLVIYSQLELSSEEKRVITAIAALQELQKLYELGFLHRDIKSDNCHAEVSGTPGQLQAKAWPLDFGGSRSLEEIHTINERIIKIYKSIEKLPVKELKQNISFIHEHNQALYKFFQGSPELVAPELLKMLPPQMIAQLHQRRLTAARNMQYDPIPYDGRFELNQVYCNPYPPLYSEKTEVYSFARMCVHQLNINPQQLPLLQQALDENPENRPNFQALLQSLQQYDLQSEVQQLQTLPTINAAVQRHLILGFSADPEEIVRHLPEKISFADGTVIEMDCTVMPPNKVPFLSSNGAENTQSFRQYLLKGLQNKSEKSTLTALVNALKDEDIDSLHAAVKKSTRTKKVLDSIIAASAAKTSGGNHVFSAKK